MVAELSPSGRQADPWETPPNFSESTPTAVGTHQRSASTSGSATTNHASQPPSKTSPGAWTTPLHSSTTASGVKLCRDGAWTPAPGVKSPTAYRPSPGPSNPPWTTQTTRSIRIRLGPRHSRRAPFRPPGRSKPSSQDQSAKAWLHRRGATWFQLSRPESLAHYAELRKLLIQHAEHLAQEIDTRAETTRCQPP